MTRPVIFLTSLMLLLGGCQSSPPPTRDYLLPSARQVSQAPERIQVQLAGYLDSGAMVLELSDTRLYQARQHRWAEPLADQIRRALDVQLTAQGIRLADYPALVVQITAFQGTPDGQARLRAHWRCGEKEGRVDWQQALPEDGYDALVGTLDQGVAEMARQLAAALQG
ncbi:hypothetical protein A11A3_03819 [Alcanivorax hongdengensis A-11-3]|uniref:ABC-type transport auxiliary lipoprotein component domain-containing protein n=1 Tax=Alcanivorax hongdengensis A-11-3 TaxID=1177179 RepID=L0WFH7_9GAMM|nr:ABC-type transport auxiliary lipoprotein family protein [Alcanivorax hongdengensis]EKF75454.1 hypothetical protein A11A3_03819 [Alcanivorax hongdengensis A-11-3]